MIPIHQYKEKLKDESLSEKDKKQLKGLLVTAKRVKKTFSNKAQKAIRRVVEDEGISPFSIAKDLGIGSEKSYNKALGSFRKKVKDVNYHPGPGTIHDVINARSRMPAFTTGRTLIGINNHGMEKAKAISKRLGQPLKQVTEIYDHSKPISLSKKLDILRKNNIKYLKR